MPRRSNGCAWLTRPVAPQAIVSRLNQEVVRYLQAPETKELFLKAGIETAPGTPEELTAVMRSEIARTEKVLKTAGTQ